MREIKNSGYSEGGASLEKKTLKTWQPRHLSALSDIDLNLRTLRNRAHSLAINSPIGSAAVNVETLNVIGSGLKVFPRLNRQVLNLSSESARELSRRIKNEFELWAGNAPSCDYLKRNNFYELQRIAFQSYLIEGDCFCLMKRRLPTADNPYSLRLQLVEAARVSNPYGVIEMKFGKNRVINGIESDSEGALEAVWISSRLWEEPTTTDATLKWERVKFFGETTGVRNVLQICADVRPNQNRGVPFLAPVVESLKQVSRYSDAELTSAIIKSFFSVFFTQPASNFSLNDITGDELDVTEYKLGSGTISALPKGVDVKAIDAQNAQNVFDSFINNFVKQIGAALNLPYEVLMNHFQSSYSASRAALLQARNEFNQRKKFFVTDFCRPIYELWLMEAAALGRIPARDFFESAEKKTAYMAADWYNEQTRFLDPVKEMEGVRRQIELGLTTRQQAAAELNGTDYWDNVATLAEENKNLTEKAEGDLE